MKRISKNIVLVIVLIMALTPLLWFRGRGNVLINGVDTNFPLDPLVWFMRRFYIWNNTLNMGSDFSSSTAGLFFHFVQVVPFVAGLSLRVVEITSLVFWFFAIVFSAYLFSRNVFSNSKLGQIGFITFYTFNTYIFNTWENVKVANLAVMAGIPYLLYVFERYKKGSSLKSTALFSVFTTLLISGSGINPAYFISIIGAFLIYTFFTVILAGGNRIRLVKGTVSILLVVAVVSFYWLIPTAHYIFTNITASNSIGDIGFTNWIDSLSENTSILNVMRLQGAWDWYANDSATGLPIYIPYAVNYFNRLPFVIYSLVLPLFAIGSYLAIKKKEWNLYASAGALMIIGIFMGAGTHPPTGELFKLLSAKVPFFSLFRSPWYIFTPYIIFSYAVLISLLFINVSTKLRDRKMYLKLIQVGFAVFVLGNIVYCYPLVTGKVFRPTRNDTFFVNFPDYVFDSFSYLEDAKKGRILSYPGDEIEQFSWKYRGVESILSLGSDREVLYSPLNATSSPQARAVSRLYLHLQRNEIEAFYNLASKLSVRYVFEKRDQHSLAMKLPEGITSLPANTFGQWSFYELPETKYQEKVYSPGKFYYVYPYDRVIEALSFVGGDASLVNSSDSQFRSTKEGVLHSGWLVFGDNQYSNNNLKVARYEVDIPEAGLYYPILERSGLEEFGIDLGRGSLEVLVDDVFTKINIERVSDSYVYFKGIEIGKGKHTLTFNIESTNLVDGLLGKGEFQRDGDGEYILGVDGIDIINTSSRDISANLEVNNFNPLSTYYVYNSYEHIYGYEASVLATQYTRSGLIKTEVEKLPNVPEEMSNWFTFYPVSTDSKLKIQLTAKRTEDELGTKIHYGEVGVYRVFTNQMVFVKEPLITLALGEVDFKENNPTSYEISNSGNPYIVFSESYSSGWNLSDSSALHFSVNGLMNGWYLGGTDKELEIKYKPQTYYIVGVVISLSVILFVVLLNIHGYITKEDK